MRERTFPRFMEQRRRRETNGANEGCAPQPPALTSPFFALGDNEVASARRFFIDYHSSSPAADAERTLSASSISTPSHPSLPTTLCSNTRLHVELVWRFDDDRTDVSWRRWRGHFDHYDGHSDEVLLYFAEAQPRRPARGRVDLCPFPNTKDVVYGGLRVWTDYGDDGPGGVWVGADAVAETDATGHTIRRPKRQRAGDDPNASCERRPNPSRRISHHRRAPDAATAARSIHEQVVRALQATSWTGRLSSPVVVDVAEELTPEDSQDPIWVPRREPPRHSTE